MESEKVIPKAGKISKTFPGVKALTDVDFELKSGEVHVLLDENGAGKSTLIKILSGILKKDFGKIFFNNKEDDYNTPLEALSRRIIYISNKLEDISLTGAIIVVAVIIYSIGKNKTA